jgi:hypothetical protein
LTVEKQEIGLDRLNHIEKHKHDHRNTTNGPENLTSQVKGSFLEIEHRKDDDIAERY